MVCILKKAVVSGLTVLLLAAVLPLSAFAVTAADDTGVSEVREPSGTPEYASYFSAVSATATNQVKIELNAAALTGDYRSETVCDASGTELSAEQKEITYTLTVPETGLYNISIVYYALSGKSKEIVFSLLLDDELPFSEAEAISLPRIYADDGEMKRDQNDNDLRPAQQEVSRWNSCLLANTDGYYEDAYALQLSAGVHTLSLVYAEESMLVQCLTVQGVTALEDYAAYSADAVESDACITLYEAEKSFEKSSSMLYPTYDRSSPATSPSHYSKMRYNTIGQSNWSHQGQWISWKITVPQDGWYSIALKARQNYQQGVNSYRTLSIDGEIPFSEVKNIEFPYSLGWYMKTLGGEETPYLFHLTAGEHTLTLTCAAGPMGEVLKTLSESVLALNGIYRSIIMVTGTTPDKYRTYYLEESVPGLLEKIEELQDSLDEVYQRITEITGTGGSQASVIREMSTMLRDFQKKPLSIPTRISSFKDTIESLGSLILTLSEQPLELDYIVVYSKEATPQVGTGFFEGISYSVKSFIASFTEDYNSVGSAVENDSVKTNVTVWLSNGRDQAQILKNMIDNTFTPKTGVGIKLSVVSTAAGTASSTLVQATLAGKGPDVALFTPKDTPVNLAMRGALTDVSQLEGFDEIYGQFYPSAWIPYEYEGGVYGVPETQNYDMLFYRTDIFEELGLTAPNTWDEFYTVIELLQKNNLGVGVPETNSANAGISSGIGFFEKLLLQNGGTYYNDKLDRTAFGQSVAYDAFSTWTELYTEYGLDRSFDFFNRFRTGEMPVGIMAYPTYNQLYAAAPEIRGLWAMTRIPGTVQVDGSVVRTETAAGTAAILLADCTCKNEAWQFIRWWTGADTQAGYGTELEASLGVAARYDTANIAAFDSIGWTDSEAKMLKSQWAEVSDIKQIPGNYFISRCLTNAFRMVVDENVNPVRALNIYNKDMNAEITRKRTEFHLE